MLENAPIHIASSALTAERLKSQSRHDHFLPRSLMPTPTYTVYRSARFNPLALSPTAALLTKRQLQFGKVKLCCTHGAHEMAAAAPLHLVCLQRVCSDLLAAIGKDQSYACVVCFEHGCIDDINVFARLQLSTPCCRRVVQDKTSGQQVRCPRAD